VRGLDRCGAGGVRRADRAAGLPEGGDARPPPPPLGLSVCHISLGKAVIYERDPSGSDYCVSS
jgi:hypothetical protein